MLGIHPGDLHFEKRGFGGGAGGVRERVEAIGEAFLRGYHAALEVADPEGLEDLLAREPDEMAGWEFKGAGMGLALRDWLTPGPRDRLTRFLSGAGRWHAPMVYLGAGWALARLPVRVDRFLSPFDPFLRWLAIDGWGFHEGFFRSARWRTGRPAPDRLLGYERRAFDQGLGRSLWFLEGGEVEGVIRTVSNFARERRPDLWGGIGLSCAYSGLPIRTGELERLRRLAGVDSASLAQGATFAAKVRQRAGNPAPHTDLACRALVGVSADEAAALADLALEGLPPDGGEPAYEVWRSRVRQRMSMTAMAWSSR